MRARGDEWWRCFQFVVVAHCSARFASTGALGSLAESGDLYQRMWAQLMSGRPTAAGSLGIWRRWPTCPRPRTPFSWPRSSCPAWPGTTSAPGWPARNWSSAASSRIPALTRAAGRCAAGGARVGPVGAAARPGRGGQGYRGPGQRGIVGHRAQVRGRRQGRIQVTAANRPVRAGPQAPAARPGLPGVCGGLAEVTQQHRKEVIPGRSRPGQMMQALYYDRDGRRINQRNDNGWAASPATAASGTRRRSAWPAGHRDHLLVRHRRPRPDGR